VSLDKLCRRFIPGCGDLGKARERRGLRLVLDLALSFLVERARVAAWVELLPTD
jgi:hypothetical protein